MSLFPSVTLLDGDVIYYSRFLDRVRSDALFAELLATIDWRQEYQKIYGKTIRLPRLTAWYGDRAYTYSGITLSPQPWTPTLRFINGKIQEIDPTAFNSVLLNLYRDGNDGVSWHSDDEKELGENPCIASVSLGGVRKFQFRHKTHKELLAIDLEPGSLLLMRGATQHRWQHRVPKTRQPVAPRINLTFRVIA